MSNVVSLINNSGFMHANTIEEAWKISKFIAESSFCPKSFTGKPVDVLMCLEMGQELGLAPLQALQNISVVNGRPSLWGDAMLAVCRRSPSFTYIKEQYDNKDNAYTCIIKRGEEPEFISRFSEADARLAGLWGKDGTWRTYPKRMLQMRARGFCLRDSFPDLLKGIISMEEAGDFKLKPKSSNNNGDTNIVDGMAENIELINAQELGNLIDIIKESKADVEKFKYHYGIEDLSHLPKSDYLRAMEILNKKIEIKKVSAREAFDEAVADSNKKIIEILSQPEPDEVIAVA